jgi:hypothetical protein
MVQMSGQPYDRSDNGFLERLYTFVSACVEDYRDTGNRKYLRKILLIDRWFKEEERGWDEEHG